MERQVTLGEQREYSHPGEVSRSSILRNFQNYLGECAWVETHLARTCDILLEGVKGQWGSEYEKQPFKIIIEATNPDLSLHDVKKIINKNVSSSRLHNRVPHIFRENTIVLSLQHTPLMCMHTGTHRHPPGKLILQKRTPILKHGFFRPGN